LPRETFLHHNNGTSKSAPKPDPAAYLWRGRRRGKRVPRWEANLSTTRGEKRLVNLFDSIDFFGCTKNMAENMLSARFMKMLLP